MIELFVPFGTMGVRIAPQGVLTAELTLTDEGDREGPNLLFVLSRPVWLMRRAYTDQPCFGAGPRGVGESPNAEQFQRNGLFVSAILRFIKRDSLFG